MDTNQSVKQTSVSPKNLLFKSRIFLVVIIAIVVVVGLGFGGYKLLQNHHSNSPAGVQNLTERSVKGLMSGNGMTYLAPADFTASKLALSDPANHKLIQYSSDG